MKIILTIFTRIRIAPMEEAQYLTFFKSLRSFIIKSKLHDRKGLNGYTMEEIRQHGGVLADDFPLAYIAFQKVLGNPARCFSVRGDYGVHVIQHSQEHQNAFQENPRWKVQVPENALTFMHESTGEGFLFFQKGIPNPPVYSFYANVESKSTPDLCANTFTSFLREDIIDTLEEKRIVDAQILARSKFGQPSAEYSDWYESFKELSKIRKGEFTQAIEKRELADKKIMSVKKFQEEWMNYYKLHLKSRFPVFDELEYFPYGWTERKYESML